jgi:hypothetical protein
MTYPPGVFIPGKVLVFEGVNLHDATFPHANGGHHHHAADLNRIIQIVAN